MFADLAGRMFIGALCVLLAVVALRWAFRLSHPLLPWLAIGALVFVGLRLWIRHQSNKW